MNNDIKTGCKNLAEREAAAAERFVAYAMERAQLTREQAITALATYRKAKVVKLGVLDGQFHVTHGAFLDAAPLRRGAGIEK